MKRTVFVGTFRHSVDDKRRLAIPAKWRAAASGSQEFYVFPLPGQHLYVLPESAMETMLAKADDISIGEYERRAILRLVSGGAHGSPCDSQGRIILTEELLKHAGIKGDACLVGMLKGFEIWNPDRHAEDLQKNSPNFAEGARQLGL